MQALIEREKKSIRGNVKQTEGKPDKLKGLILHLNNLKEDKFTGYIKINYSQGSIGRIEKFEEILKRIDD